MITAPHRADLIMPLDVRLYHFGLHYILAAHLIKRYSLVWLVKEIIFPCLQS